MEQHRLTQEAVFGAVARLGNFSDMVIALVPVTTAEVHREISKEYPDSSFRTPTREAVYLQLHRLKKKRLLLSKRQGKEVSWELAARGRRLLEKKAQQKEMEARMKEAAEREQHATDGSECWSGPENEKSGDLDDTVELPAPGTIEEMFGWDPEEVGDGALRDADPIYLDGSPKPNNDEEDDGA